MPTDDRTPLYAQIAAGIREQIAVGQLAEGARVPSESELMEQHQVARGTARRALQELRAEGLITTVSKSRSFVRTRPALRERSSAHYRRPRAGENTSPFARDAESEGKLPSWDHETVHWPADAAIAERLGVEVGEMTVRTTYLFKADGRPVQTSVSWEPLANIEGTPVEWPEGEDRITGVIARLDSIGVHIDLVEERVRVREPHASERVTLDIPDNVQVITIARTQLAQGRIVEVCDIVIPADRYELVYEIPVPPAED